MKSEDIGNLINSLWSCYDAEIKTGMPVYFCFHKAQIRLQLLKNGLRSSDYIEEFLKVARSYLVIDKGVVRISNDAFTFNKTGHSAVILLVAFQVLAVELMDKDEQGIGADAYFPRLRKLISKDIEPIGRLPFEEGDFSRLWSQFRDEIFLRGGQPQTITFSEGIGRKDKNRNFPISQALLSQAELLKVARVLYGSTQAMPRQHEIPILLRKLRHELPSRVKEKLSRPIQKPKIIEQIHLALKILSVDQLLFEDRYSDEDVDTEDLNLRAFLEGFGEEFLYIEGWTDQNEKKDLHHPDLVAILKQSPLVVLGRQSKNKFYWTDDITCNLSDLEDFVVVYQKEKQPVFNYFADTCLNHYEADSQIKSEFKDFVVLRFDRSMLNKDCSVIKGIPNYSPQDKMLNEVHFKGGIQVSNGKFLKGFPIFGMSVDGVIISNSAKGSLDGQIRVISEIIAILNDPEIDRKYVLEISGAQKTMVFVKAKPELEAVPNYCYEFKNRRIIPVKVFVGKDISYLKGFQFHINDIFAALRQMQNHILLLDQTLLEEGVIMNDWQFEKVCEGVRQLNIQDHLKKIMLLNLQATGRVPSGFLNYF